jgi:hypothetical protein
VNEHLKLLGFQVRDVVTGFKGAVVSITFDLYGCVQAYVYPAMNKEGKLGDGHWFDTKRLEALGKKPLMNPPTFEVVPGGQDLPSYPSQRS